MQLNKINQPVFTAVTNYSTSDDGSINARYIVGAGNLADTGDVPNFQLICESWKYVSKEDAKELMDQPLTADDLGKSPNEIMLSRIYTHLKEKGEIVI